ncbi:MAG: VPDSG-CTERM sorting domain-containing protein [Sphingobacteriales bacterium]|nr:MAG: VPDSG-CTERM sorting domain-containing protein [Sphingobacteriales bacterium]
MKLKTTPIFAAVGMAVLGLASTASAAFITGIITFGDGEGTYNAGHTAITAITVQPEVEFASGDFAGLTGSIATFKPFSFNSGAVPALWTVGGFTFSLTSGTLDLSSPLTIASSGVGTITAPGFSPTNGTFAFSGNPGTLTTSFAFTAASVAQGTGVPDGGATVALLGVSLLGLHTARRKLMKA